MLGKFRRAWSDSRPHDVIYFMDLVVITVIAIAVILAVALVIVLLFSLELEPKASVPPRSATLDGKHPALTNPLPCDATMVVSVGGVITSRGCYIRKEPGVWL